MMAKPPVIPARPLRPKRRFVGLAVAGLALGVGWLALRPLLVRSMILPRLVLVQPLPELKAGWSLPVDASVGAVAISPDGRTVWSGGAFPLVDVRGKTYLSPARASIQAWDARSGQRLYTLPGHRRLVEALAVSPNGRCLASSGGDDTVKLWDTASHQQIWGRPGSAVSLSFSPDGEWLAVDGELWNTHTGQMSRAVSEKIWDGSGTSFSPDSVQSACVDDHYRVVSDPAGIFQGTSRDPQQGTYGVIGRHPQLWDTATGKLKRVLPYNLGQAVAFSPDGKSLACLCEVADEGVGGVSGAAIYLVDAQTGLEKWRWLRHNEGETIWAMTALAFSPNGRWLAGATLDGKAE